MPTRFYFILLIFMPFIGCQKTDLTSPSQNRIQIPTVKNIQLDSQLNDWNHQGYNLPLFVDTNGEYNKNDFNATVKIGWNEQGLLLACDIHDDSLYLTNKQILRNDALEIFISKNVGTRHMHQYLLPLGIIDGESEIRVDMNDSYSGGIIKNNHDIKICSQKKESGYLVEILVPSSVMNLEQGEKPGIQLIFHDVDSGAQGDHKTFVWNYCYNTYINNYGLQNISLVENTVPATTNPLHVGAHLVDGEYYDIYVTGDSSFSSKKFIIRNKTKILYQEKFSDTKEAAVVRTPIKARGREEREEFTLLVDDEPVYKLATSKIVYKFTKPTTNRSAKFENEIRFYEYKMAVTPPTKDAILFLGSSTIRLWRTVADDFPDKNIALCGFGGSQTGDMLYFFDRIIKPFPYKKIVYFCGINDINAKIPQESIIENTQNFIKKIEENNPSCEIILLSNAVSPNKRHNFDKIVKLNTAYQQLAKEYDSVKYVDVFTPMLSPNGAINPGFYSADSTHMNPKGYKFWVKILGKEL